MIYVKVDHPDQFDKYVRIFKKLVQRSGMLQEIKARRYYMKPSEKRRLKRKENAKRR